MSAFLSLFANPAFLAGIALASIPVVIHLLARHRARELAFPSLRFLQRTAERTARRRRLEDILLLLLRAGALALTALALAHPRANLGPVGRGQGVRALLLVDNSLSMQQAAEGLSAAERVAAMSRDVVMALPPGSRWGVWNPCAQAKDDPARAMLARDEAGALLSGAAKATAAHARMDTLLAEAISFLQEADGVPELYLFSDLQRAAFENVKRELAGCVRVQPIRIFIAAPSGVGQSNLAVESVAVRCRVPLAGEPGRVHAVLRSFSAREEHTTIALYLNGVVVERRGVTLPLRGTLGETFPVRLAPGWMTGFVRIDGDANSGDNRAYLALPVADRISVLLVDGQGGLARRDRAAVYIEAALAPRPESPVRVRVIAPADLVRERLAGYGCVFLIDPPALSEPACAAIRRFARRGGTVVFLPGENTGAEWWNRHFGSSSDEAGGLLPAAVGEESEPAAEALSLVPAETGHRLLAEWKTVAAEHLGRVRIHRRRILDAGDPISETAISFSDGRIFAASKRYYEGVTIIWAALPAPAWGTLQARPIFVPFVHAHMHMGRGGAHIVSRPAGSPLPLLRPENPQTAGATVKSPSGNEISMPPVEVSHENPLLYADTWSDGLYTVSMTGPDMPERIFAVSADSADADLSVMDEQALMQALSRFGPVRMAHSAAALAEEVLAARRATDLTDPLLGVVVLLLLAEGAYGALRARHAAL